MRYSLIPALLICLVLPFEAAAVPAAPIVHTLTQPDGSTFSARQWGDENLNGWDTEDGYTVVFDQQIKSWTYAVHASDGNLMSSSIVVGRERVPKGLSKKLRPKGKALQERDMKRLTREMRQLSTSPQGHSEGSPQYVVAPTGTGKIPVVLINFNNTTATYTPGDVNALLFGTGNYSMKDYYEEVSYGTFTVSAGPGGVVGWYTAASTHDYYGYANGFERAAALAKEAVMAADAAGFDFAPYDQDGDCYVDAVNIVHQGTGAEASANYKDIWSHRWNLASSGVGIYTTNDNCTANPAVKVKIDDYVMQPEKLGSNISTMGVFAHEYGHALGLPDLYDTDGTSEGIGNWSLMAGGSWNGVTRGGDRPAHADAWCKYYLGWTAPTTVSGILVDEPITQASSAPDVYKLLAGTPLSGEYFLIENRQKTGFDAGLPGPGLLIWHIDGDTISSKMILNSVNNYECYPLGPSCSTDHYGVKLVQADNLWEMEKSSGSRGNAGDTYQLGGNSTFDAASSPNSNLYNGSASNASVTSISAAGQTMTATLSDGTADATPPTGTISISSGAAFTKSLDVQLTLSATDPSGISDMCISNTNSCSAWETYATSKAWTLTGGADGTRAVYAWFRDGLNNENVSPFSDTIVVDTIAPTDGSVSADALEGKIELTWTGFSDINGVAGYIVVIDTASVPSDCSTGTLIYSGGNTSYSHTGLASGNSYYYRVCALDAAANESGGATISSYIPIFRHVCPTGCATYTLIQNAIDASGSGDVIKLVQGAYHENIVIDAPKEITIVGGYDASFDDPPAHDPALTIIDGDSLLPYDGAGDGSVVSISAGTDIILENVTIMNGDAASGGGISFLPAADGQRLEIRNSMIRNNVGGIVAYGPASGTATVEVINSFIVENAASYGGGLAAYAVAPGSTLVLKLINSTVSENHALLGAGLFASSASGTVSADAVNSIIWSNRRPDRTTDDIYYSGGGAQVQAGYSNIGVVDNDGTGFYGSSGTMINEDPVFINPALYNYRINADSPAVNQGTIAGTPDADFENNGRIIDAGPDMGADEYVQTVPASVRLLSLNGGEIIQAGMPYDITWESPPTARSFKVFYSFDNGLTWLKPKSTDSAVAGNVVNDRKHFRWDVPVMKKNKKNCRIKVIGYSGINGTGDRIGVDKSDLPFMAEVVRIVSPNGGAPVPANTSMLVRWITTENPKAEVSRVKLLYTTNGGTSWKQMALQDPIIGNPGEAVWLAPAVSRSKCKVKILLYDADDGKVGSDSSDVFFAIGP